MVALLRRPGSPKDPLGSWMNGQLRGLKVAENQARRTAATTATKGTQGKFVYARPHTSPRRARRGSMGPGMRMSRNLVWKDNPTKHMVEFDVDSANRRARHWIIQEIGSGETARVLTPGGTGPGRPRKETQRRVPSQVGRRIRTSVVFGTGPGGKYLRPTRGRSRDQMFLAKDLTGAPWPRPRIVIRKNIKGQHMVQTGGEEGFRQYRDEVLAVARRSFKGFPFRT